MKLEEPIEHLHSSDDFDGGDDDDVPIVEEKGKGEEKQLECVSRSQEKKIKMFGAMDKYYKPTSKGTIPLKQSKMHDCLKKEERKSVI